MGGCGAGWRSCADSESRALPRRAGKRASGGGAPGGARRSWGPAGPGGPAMSLDRLRVWWGRDPWVLLAALVWALALAVVCVLAGLRPRSHSLFPTFAAAGQDWVAGSLLYDRTWKPDQDVYRYSPLAAVLLVPFSCLPEWLGGVVW